ncbi:hypothetical protein CEXT_278801 [Caerostris extrusa]|uniref:Uncharacterized protein n=1 Tax=Caerostris extrusa TaxID=172846 RepID=A0AAV4M6F1_CAEEX|nr:hypothetical protein CEXT_278801 [Caerostris extrusa]
MNVRFTDHKSGRTKIIDFGGKEDTQSTIRNRVRFLLADEKTEHTMSIEALETEIIYPNIMAAPTLELRDKIRKLGIDLSDVSCNLNQGNKIDVLIGADYYWTIMTGKYKCLSPTVDFK